MCQGDNDLAVRGERPSQFPDRAAELDQPGQVVGDVLRCAGHDPRVQLLKLALDSLEGAEVAGDDPLETRGDDGRGIERTTWPPPSARSRKSSSTSAAPR